MPSNDEQARSQYAIEGKSQRACSTERELAEGRGRERGRGPIPAGASSVAHGGKPSRLGWVDFRLRIFGQARRLFFPWDFLTRSFVPYSKHQLQEQREPPQTHTMAAPPAMVMPVDESEQQIESLQGHSHTSVLPFLSQDLLEQQSRYRKQQQQQQQQTASSSEKQSEAAAAAPHHQHPPNSGEGGQQRATRLAPPQSLSGTMLQNIPPRSNNTRTNILDYLA